MYTYTWYQWLAFFYIYCFFGWIFESSYVSLKNHHPVNRGFLRLPMLPLYGSGAVMMLWVSLPVQNNLLLVWGSGVIAATSLEYITGSIMEQLFKIRYWDYSSQKFQIRGYICLTSSIAWGFLTILMTEVIHEPVARAVLSLDHDTLYMILAFLSVLFLTDVYASTKAALVLGKSLEAMTKLRADIEELQNRIAAVREEAAEQFSSAKSEATDWLGAFYDEASERLSSARDDVKVHLASLREDASEKISCVKRSQSDELSRLRKELDAASEKRRSLLTGNSLHRFYSKALLRGNPGAASARFAAALRELRDELKL